MLTHSENDLGDQMVLYARLWTVYSPSHHLGSNPARTDLSLRYCCQFACRSLVVFPKDTLDCSAIPGLTAAIQVTFS